MDRVQRRVGGDPAQHRAHLRQYLRPSLGLLSQCQIQRRLSGVLKRVIDIVSTALLKILSLTSRTSSRRIHVRSHRRLCDFAGRQVTAFKSKAPQLPRANYTASYIYLIPHDGSKKPVAINGPDSPDSERRGGRLERPSFSPTARNRVLSDREQHLRIRSTRFVYLHHRLKETIARLAHNWDRSPDTAKWTADGKTLIISSEDSARVRLFTIPLNADDDYKLKTSPTAA